DRYHLADVDVPRIRAAARPGVPAAQALPADDRGEPSVERHQRHYVAQGEDEVQLGGQRHDDLRLAAPADVRGNRLAGLLAEGDHAGDLAAGLGRPLLAEQLAGGRRQVRERMAHAAEYLAGERPGELSGAQRARDLERGDRRDPHVGAGPALDLRQLHVLGQQLTIASYRDRDLGAGLTGLDQGAEGGPVAHRLAVVRHDRVPGTQPRGNGRRRRLGSAAPPVVQGGDAGRDARGHDAELGGVVVRDPDGEGEADEQYERQNEVHDDPGVEHDDPLPPGLAPEGPGLVVRVMLLVERVHADDLAEAAYQQRLDAVLGFAAAEGPQRR